MTLPRPAEAIQWLIDGACKKATRTLKASECAEIVAYITALEQRPAAAGVESLARDIIALTYGLIPCNSLDDVTALITAFMAGREETGWHNFNVMQAVFHHMQKLGLVKGEDIGEGDTVEDGAQVYIRVLDRLAGRGWQPIETAPKDGTRVLLHTTDPEHPVCEALFNVYWGDPVYSEWDLLDEQVIAWQPLPAPSSVGKSPSAVAPQGEDK